MKQPSFLNKFWRVVRWPLAVIVVLYFALVLYRIPAVGEQQRTAEAIQQIQSHKVTLADAMGTNLPPQPYKPENDATVAGIDKNNNNIRDDVELAIFAEYPDSAKIRAAELQYAMTEQMFLTEVFNKETWVAAANSNSRASDCISLTYPRTNLEEYIKITDGYSKEVEDRVFNTQLRKDARDKAFDFITSYGEPDPEACDLDISQLSN